MEDFYLYIKNVLEKLLVLIEPFENSRPARIKYAVIRIQKACSARSSKRYIEPVSFKRNSPALFFLVRLFSYINQYIDFYDRNDRKISVDALKIRNNSQWITETAVGPNDVMAYISGKCGIKCDFCYLKGNPDFMNRLNRGISEDEILYRLELFKHGKCFTQRNILSTDEQTTHPLFLSALKGIREKNRAPVYIETNGVNLTEDMIKSIKKLGRIHLNVSVNILTEELRKSILCDKKPDRIRKNLRLLSENEIPYSVSIVPWHTVPEEETAKIAEFCSDINVNHILIRLPGYTSFYSRRKLYDLDELWSKNIDIAEDIRNRFQIPVIVQPSKYEQLRADKYWEYPFVLGIIKNSPASRSGLKYSDHILRINGQRMLWRNEAIKSLLMHHINESDINLRILRDGVQSDIRVKYGSGSYPYDVSDYRCPYGIYSSDDIDYKSLIYMKNLISVLNPQNAVLITSKLMLKSYKKLVELFNLKKDFENLKPHIVPNLYFGGNVFMGDLLVVSDIIDYLDSLHRQGKDIDAVLIPSSMFNEYGNDLLGRCYKEIEYITGRKVFLIPAHIISL